MKNKNNIIFGVISITIIVLLVIVSPMLTKNAKSINYSSDDQEIFSRATIESNSVSDDEKKLFDDIDVDNYLTIAHNEKKSLVLVGRNGCQYCQIAEPIIQKIMYDNDLNVYYVSTDYFDEESYQKFSDSNDLLKSFATPLLMVVSNDQINDYVQGLQDTKGYKDFLIKNGFNIEVEE